MKRKYIANTACIILLVFFAVSFSMAGEVKKIKPIICSISNYYECSLTGGCEARTAEELNGLRFFEILLDKKEIHLLGRGNGSERVTKIQHLAVVDGILLIQGVERANQGGAIGWTISINKISGQMTFTASGNEVGYTGLGYCTVY